MSRAALLLVLVLGAGCGWESQTGDASSARAQLAAAPQGDFRAIQGRLTGGFPYSPYDPQARLPMSPELREVLREIEGASKPDRAVADLLSRNTERAVARLEEALEEGSPDAALLSDLAAAHLAQARTGQDPYSFVQALERAEQAVALNPHLPEALFNRALALGSLHLAGQARLAWDAYLKIDRDSPWREEARRRKVALDVPDPAKTWEIQKKDLHEAALLGDQARIDQIVSRFPQAAREHAEEDLLGAWAEAWLAGRREEAGRSLEIARAIGAALVKKNGERMVSDAVEAIVKDEKGILADGHRQYQEGLSLYGKGEIVEAKARFDPAEFLLRRGGSPFAGWAAFRRAVCEMQGFRYEEALDQLDPLRFQDTYPSLAGRSHWVAGLIHGIQARPTESLAAYRFAQTDFHALGENENGAHVSALIAEGLRNSGDTGGAWLHHVTALRSLDLLRNPVRRQIVLEGAAFTALASDKPLVALSFQQETFRALSASDNSAAWIYGLWRRSLIQIRAGRPRQAMNDLAEARARLAQVSDHDSKRLLLGNILAVEGQLPESGDLRQIQERISAAIEIYRRSSYQNQLGFLYARRGRNQVNLGRLDLAEADFEEAIRCISHQRAAISDGSLRTAFQEQSRSTFEEMVRLQARQGRADKALEYAEDGRIQLFRQQTSNSVKAFPSSPGAAEISARIPKATALIEYMVFEDRLLAWVVRSDSRSPVLFSREISRSSLARQVEDIRNTSASGSGELFELLMGQLRPALQGIDSLVLVPDRELYSLPFAALRDSSGQYLVERYTLSISPSAGLYLRALEGGRSPSPHLQNILVIGDPALDRTVLPHLPRLSKAEREAAEIAALYPRAGLLTGSEATRKRLLEGLGRYEILHFSGHAVSNPVSPQSSFLALAPSPAEKDSGILYARELYDRAGVKARLVILSACGTTYGDSHQGEGIAGLARPFLTSGVPAVIGSLWKVDDHATMVLSVELHRGLRRGLSAAEALRRAQLALLAHPDPSLAIPASWAGFQLIGAGTSSDVL